MLLRYLVKVIHFRFTVHYLVLVNHNNITLSPREKYLRDYYYGQNTSNVKLFGIAKLSLKIH